MMTADSDNEYEDEVKGSEYEQLVEESKQLVNQIEAQNNLLRDLRQYLNELEADYMECTDEYGPEAAETRVMEEDVMHFREVVRGARSKLGFLLRRHEVVREQLGDMEADTDESEADEVFARRVRRRIDAAPVGGDRANSDSSATERFVPHTDRVLVGSNPISDISGTPTAPTALERSHATVGIPLSQATTVDDGRR
ncbi:MAG: hypothetical protein HQL31_06775 [Planctomycetes bacterium]|nr:hypothetical protein [Planctomycetota bacterium]